MVNMHNFTPPRFSSRFCFVSGLLLMAGTLAACTGCGEKNGTTGPSAMHTTTSASTPADNVTMPSSSPQPNATPSDPALSSDKVVKTDAQWRAQLTPLEYSVLREKSTERAFSGKLWNTKGDGDYSCAACGNLLFTGDDKFISDCGWPAFDKCIKGSINEHVDRSFGMARTEVTCAKCDGHLGHIFDDGPTATGMRYCINSVCITFTPKPQK